ncbi:hypothetical protein ABEB36_011901 [Hypothenemus hampei]|uniref:Uncharacterized protein n=1 Tax=Hypothenemus hampei TaxID=57062 RepID=A0ABD1EBF8_HYPHA
MARTCNLINFSKISGVQLIINNENARIFATVSQFRKETSKGLVVCCWGDRTSTSSWPMRRRLSPRRGFHGNGT